MHVPCISLRTAVVEVPAIRTRQDWVHNATRLHFPSINWVLEALELKTTKPVHLHHRPSFRKRTNATWCFLQYRIDSNWSSYCRKCPICESQCLWKSKVRGAVCHLWMDTVLADNVHNLFFDFQSLYRSFKNRKRKRSALLYAYVYAVALSIWRSHCEPVLTGGFPRASARAFASERCNILFLSGRHLNVFPLSCVDC